MSRDILLSLIDTDPGQPRKHFDQAGLEELAQSMRANGLAVPILLRPVDERYIVVHGERRLRAARLLEWESIPADVRDMTLDEARWLALVENIQRADLSPIEEAEAYQAALSEGMTQTELGKRIGKTQSYIAQKLRLLKAPAPVRALIAKGALSEGHIRQLLRLEGIYPSGKAGKVATRPIIEGDNYKRDPCYLVAAYNVLRPEDNPEPPLWQYPYANVERCPHIASLYESLEALAGEPSGEAPQWVITAFWMGAAAVVFGLSVADLAKLIDGLRERLYSALMYLSITPKPSGPSRDDAAFWWGMQSDLRHGHCLPLVDGDLRHIMDSGCELGDLWLFPSSMQPWGTNAEAGRRLEARDQGNTDFWRA